MGLQTLENKVLSRGIIGKSAPILAEITIRKSQAPAGYAIYNAPQKLERCEIECCANEEREEMRRGERSHSGNATVLSAKPCLRWTLSRGTKRSTR
jgi:hypothetical protein